MRSVHVHNCGHERPFWWGNQIKTAQGYDPWALTDLTLRGVSGEGAAAVKHEAGVWPSPRRAPYNT
jgi:hypothetical protein